MCEHFAILLKVLVLCQHSQVAFHPKVRKYCCQIDYAMGMMTMLFVFNAADAFAASAMTAVLSDLGPPCATYIANALYTLINLTGVVVRLLQCLRCCTV